MPLLDYIVIIGYFVGITVIGLYTSKKVSNQGDFYVGGRRFGKILVTMQSFGVGTSNTHPVLIAGAVYTYGMTGIWYSWLYMLFMPFGWILQPITRRLRIYTSADYFDLRYSKGLGPFYSVSSLLNVSVMVGTVLLGMGQIVEGVTDGALTKAFTIPLAALVIILYGTAGGMLAAAVTDVVQGVMILLLSVMLLPPLFNEVGGMSGLHEVLACEKFSLAMPQGGSAATDIGLFAIFMLCINGLMGNLVEPMKQTEQAAKDEWTLRLGGQIGAFMKRFCTVAWALVGLCALAIWPNLEDPEMSFGLATRTYLPVGFSGLMIACMMAAAMSTCDAAMVCGAAIFSRNLYAKYICKQATDKHYLFVARIVGVICVLCGLLVAFWFGSVRQAVEFWWKVTAFVGPTLLLGLFFRRGNSWGAWACIITSAIVWAVTLKFLVPLDEKWSTVWYQSMLYLPAGILAYFIVSYLTKPEDERKLARFYARLNTPVGQEQQLMDFGFEDDSREIAGSPL